MSYITLGNRKNYSLLTGKVFPVKNKQASKQENKSKTKNLLFIFYLSAS
jgi:hypothetical protein